MLNKKDFLKYASKLAFPIMIQNLIGTMVYIAGTVMLRYVSQTAMSASSWKSLLELQNFILNRIPTHRKSSLLSIRIFMKPRSVDENPFADLNLNLLQRKVHEIHLFMDFSPRYPGIRDMFFCI